MEKKATSAGRAWRILRMALLWARKGGAFRRWRLMLGLRIALKSLRHGAGGGARAAERIRCMERQLSFDETPSFGFKMRSRRPATSLRYFPKIPCISTAPSVHLDEGSDWIFYKGEKESKFFRGDQENEECSSTENYDDDEDEFSENSEEEVTVEEEEEELEGIDSKAEEFISNFYEQMKLQRQVSLIQYDEMLRRGVS